MVEDVDRGLEKQIAEVLEVVNAIDPGKERPLVANIQAIGDCCPDDLKALFSRPQPLIKPADAHLFPTAA